MKPHLPHPEELNFPEYKVCSRHGGDPIHISNFYVGKSKRKLKSGQIKYSIYPYPNCKKCHYKLNKTSVTKTPEKHEEYKAYLKKYHQQRCKNHPDFRKNNNDRKNRLSKKRYQTDPEYREKKKAYNRNFYHKNKAINSQNK